MRPLEVFTTYAPLTALAVALVSLTFVVCKRGHDYLARSLWGLGTIMWMTLGFTLGASEPVRRPLTDTPFHEFAPLVLDLLAPLACVLVGAVWAKSNRNSIEVLGYTGIFAGALAAAFSSIPYLVDNRYGMAALWMLPGVAAVIWLRLRARRAGGTKMREISSGALKDRLKELAARAGHPGTRLYVNSSPRNQHANAFALRGYGVVVTAPLLAAFPRSEVDAILAHELSHFRKTHFNAFAVLAIAIVATHTVLSTLASSPTSALVIQLAPPAMFFAALYGARKREFAADAGSATITGDPRAMIRALARLVRIHKRPLEASWWIDFLSTHPSIGRRIRALAARAGLSAEEVSALHAAAAATIPENDQPYETPADPDPSGIFSPAWQTANGNRYAWTVLLAVPVAAVAAALLTELLIAWIPSMGFAPYFVGIIVGCVLAKGIVVAVMARGYALLSRRLSQKLSAQGILTGLAPGETPRLFNGHRYSDAGLVWFEGGQFHYRSERVSIAFQAADVISIDLVRAAPAQWIAHQPRLRFRDPQTGQPRAFILHPLFGASGLGLRRQIEQWRARREISPDGAGFRGHPRGNDSTRAVRRHHTRIQTLWRSDNGGRDADRLADPAASAPGTLHVGDRVCRLRAAYVSNCVLPSGQRTTPANRKLI
jgi:heat shock protein HtpX